MGSPGYNITKQADNAPTAGVDATPDTATDISTEDGTARSIAADILKTQEKLADPEE